MNHAPILPQEPDTRQAPNLVGILATALDARDEARALADELHAQFLADEAECSEDE